MVVHPGVLLDGLSTLLAVVRLSLEVKILSLDKLPAVIFGVVASDHGLALDPGWVVCVACRAALVSELISSGCEDVERDLVVLGRFVSLVLNLNRGRISRSLWLLLIGHALVQIVVQLASLEPCRRPRPSLLQVLSR